MTAGLLVAGIMLATATYTITPDASLAAGVPVTFTVTFPAEAARNARHPQYHDQPVFQANCGTWQTNQYLASQKRQKDGSYIGDTYPVALPSGDCTLTTYYFDVAGELHVIASIQVTVP